MPRLRHGRSGIILCSRPALPSWLASDRVDEAAMPDVRYHRANVAISRDSSEALGASTMSGLTVTTLSTKQLVANDYNPNRLTDAEFTELVDEISISDACQNPSSSEPTGQAI